MVEPPPSQPPPPSTWRERLELLAGAGASTPGRLVGLAVAVGVALVALVLWLRRPPPPPELSLPRADRAAVEDPAAAEQPAEVYAHAAGAVMRPGVYRLPGGARVTALVDAAGGLTPDADPDRLNLAAEVADGQRVYVPRKGEAVEPPADAGSGGGGDGVAAGAPVNLNTATMEELDRLPGVGPATAQAILDHRRRHGPFRSVEDLLDVRGIGEAKLEALRDLVSV